VKKSVEALVGYATSEWALKANTPNVRKKTDEFLRKVKFLGPYWLKKQSFSVEKK
jgi:hypothetical protein